MATREQILFLCTHNSARSQMAEGLLKAMGGDRYEAHSAGTTVTKVRPEAVQVMNEIGIDISQQESKSVGRYLNTNFNWVITVCDDAAETCPAFPGSARRLHWSLPDPGQTAGSDAERLATFREIRDRLRQLLEDFLHPQ